MAAPRIAAFPKCYIEDIVSGRMDLLDWIDGAVALEPEGLELYAGFLHDRSAPALKAVRQRAEGHGLPIPMLCYSPDFTQPDPDARQREVAEQIEMIRVTAELGGTFCRTLSGQRRDGLAVDDGVDMVVSCIEQCLPEAERCGVCVVMENHYKDGFWQFPEFAQQMDVFLKVIGRIDSPRFGVQYDPSNAIVAGDDPLELLARVKHRVLTMHASDRYLLPGHSLEELKEAEGQTGYADILQHGVTGKGMNDYEAIFTTLREVDFDGWISIEDGMNGMDEMRESIDFLKAMREKHFGGGRSA